MHAGNAGGMAQFAYYDQGGVTSTVIEVMELTDATRWLATTVREAADHLGRFRSRPQSRLRATRLTTGTAPPRPAP